MRKNGYGDQSRTGNYFPTQRVSSQKLLSKAFIHRVKHRQSGDSHCYVGSKIAQVCNDDSYISYFISDVRKHARSCVHIRKTKLQEKLHQLLWLRLKKGLQYSGYVFFANCELQLVIWAQFQFREVRTNPLLCSELLYNYRYVINASWSTKTGCDVNGMIWLFIRKRSRYTCDGTRGVVKQPAIYRIHIIML